MMNFETFENLVVTLWESGYSEWYSVKQSSLTAVSNKYPDMEGEPFSLKLARYLWEGNKLPLWDEYGEEKIGSLSLTGKYGSLNDLVMAFASEYPEYYADIKYDNADAVTADSFFQFAVLGDIEFA